MTRTKDLEEALILISDKVAWLCNGRGLGCRMTYKDWAELAQLVNNSNRALAGRPRIQGASVGEISVRTRKAAITKATKQTRKAMS